MSYIDEELDPAAPWNQDTREVTHTYTLRVISTIATDRNTPREVEEDIEKDDYEEVRGQIECALDETDLHYTIE